MDHKIDVMANLGSKKVKYYLAIVRGIDEYKVKEFLTFKQPSSTKETSIEKLNLFLK
jgi:hypothetical protein